MTSEPVGNSRRGSLDAEIPGNSHKQRAAAAPQPEREKLDKVVVGKVTIRKQPLHKRIMRGLIAEDVTNVGDFVLTQVIGPAVRDLIANIIGQGTNQLLYGKSARRPMGIQGNILNGAQIGRVAPGNAYHQGSNEPRRILTREAQTTHNFTDIVMDNAQDAAFILQALQEQIVRFKVATVADFYDLLGQTGSYQDRAFGWYNLDNADIRPVRGGFLIDLPPTQEINR